MNATWLRVAGVVGGFLLVFATGFWLRLSGRPYGTGLLTVHKLVSVGILVFLGMSVYGAGKASAQGVLVWVVVSLAVLTFVATIASGGALRHIVKKGLSG